MDSLVHPERPLDPTERRVLGVLLEKELATPQLYPLSVNALTAGCNQKNNRDPVTHHAEFEVEGTLRSLFIKRWVTNASGDGRVTRHRHRAEELLSLDQEARAVLAELLLRGPQQPGQLRTRTARMTKEVEDPRGVDAALETLEQAGLARRHPRVPGERHDRWGQTLGAEEEVPAPVEPPAPEVAPTESDPGSTTAPDLVSRVEELERRVAELESRLQD